MLTNYVAVNSYFARLEFALFNINIGIIWAHLATEYDWTI